MSLDLQQGTSAMGMREQRGPMTMDDLMLKRCNSATRGPLDHVARDCDAGMELKAHYAKGFRF